MNIRAHLNAATTKAGQVQLLASTGRDGTDYTVRIPEELTDLVAGYAAKVIPAEFTRADNTTGTVWTLGWFEITVVNVHEADGVLFADLEAMTPAALPQSATTKGFLAAIKAAQAPKAPMQPEA